MHNLKDLIAYKKSFALAMDVFNISKKFPIEERYSLTDQIRRSSRSVCANLGEAYGKRQYLVNFTKKIADCDGENQETMVWLDFAYKCGYIDKEEFDDLISKCEEVGRLLGSILKYPEKFIGGMKPITKR